MFRRASMMMLLCVGASGCMSTTQATDRGRVGCATSTGKSCKSAKTPEMKRRQTKETEAAQAPGGDSSDVCDEDGSCAAGVSPSCPGETVRAGDVCECSVDMVRRGATCRASARVGMVHVPEGKFWMGSVSGERDEDPMHEVYVSGFFIDTYEVTVAEYKRCVDAGVCSGPKKTHKVNRWYNYNAPGRSEHPINGVNWYQANDYCVWAGKRLPTEAEWEKAARGEDDRMYPWGDEAPSCAFAVMDDGRGVGCGKDHTWVVGSKPEGVSPYGAHNMSGNVWEWTADWYDPGYYDLSPSSDPTGPDSPIEPSGEPTQGPGRVGRGGSWFDFGTSQRASARGHFTPDSAHFFLGFRCVKST